MIAIIDYGMGNLRSVQKALEKAGAKTIITDDPSIIKQSQKVVLPGVGAIAPAIKKLQDLKLIDAIKEFISQGKPFLGICLGLHLLFNESDEGNSVKALGILPGTVKRFSSLKVPHIGWNQLNIKRNDCPLLKGIEDKANFYFCHSYFVKPDDPQTTLTTTDYGIDFTSSIWKDNVFGVQFHPEKSQTIGLQILKNFNDLNL